MSIRRDERGQSAVYVVVFLTVLIGMAAAVLDVGSWYRADRAAQAAADATALAGAQDLPSNPGQAQLTAMSYANKNGGGVSPSDILISNTKGPNDTITVHVTRPAPGFFSKIFGVASINVHAKAAARSFIPGSTKYVAPIVVNIMHPKLSGGGCPCYGPSNQTILPLGKTGAPGAFNLINLNNDSTGTVGASQLADWINTGYQDYLDLREYYSDPGTKWNNSTIQDALNQRIGTEILFPIFDVLQGTGSNAQYRVIAWVGFHLTAKTVTGGDTGSIQGWFTRVIWTGLEASGGTPPDFGVRTVILID
jgi:hypothetical protein